MNKYILIIYFFFAGMIPLYAEIHLPALIGDNMVLQQQINVNLWGTATPGKQIKIHASWSTKQYNVKSDSQGNWILSVKTPQAGGPYTISFFDGKEKKISNVMIGEVWLCSGQSNMEMPLKGYSGQPVNDAQNTISKATPEVPIRFFNVAKNTSLTPIENIDGCWQDNRSENVKNFSATAYFYAQFLQSVLNVPVGIISSSWGGSSIEAWMDSTELSKLITLNLSNEGNLSPVFQRHSQLYNAMIYPLRNFTIKGVLWYQAEANVHRHALYEKQFPAMVAQWRKLWRLGEFPFYYAQIAPWKYNGVYATASARMREVQQRLLSVIRNSGMIVTLDVGDSLVIHSPMKKLIGERFAYLALNKTYNYKGIEYRAPQFKSMVVKHDTIVLDFDYATEGLHSSTNHILGFEIAGSDSIFKPAHALLTDKATRIQLFESTIFHPVAVRYAFKNYSPTSLFSNMGFPLTSFRTDNWDDNN